LLEFTPFGVQANGAIANPLAGSQLVGEDESLGSIPSNGRETYKRKEAGMNFPEIVIGYLISINLIGLVLGIYGLGMAKGWWR
jgi:hypothetical protein